MTNSKEMGVGLGTVKRRAFLKMTAAAGALAMVTELPSEAKESAQKRLQTKGVVYDVGLRFTPGQPYSVEPFNRELVRYDISAIANDLHANTVRIEGEEIDRLVIATRFAHAAGLRVFFNPWKMNVPVSELGPYYGEAARAAEQLRQEGIDLVFVCGCEMSIFNAGIFPGATLMDRIGGMAKGPQWLQEKSTILNDTLRPIVGNVRSVFKGKVAYSSGAWETIDWNTFDVVGVDYYRNAESAAKYVAGLDAFRVKNKPLVVMEVGCCAYEGAAPRGGGGFMVLEGRNPDGTGKFTGGVVPKRSEQEQADYDGEQLKLLTDAGVDGVFIYVFSFPSMRVGEGARDMDMISFSLVKTFPDNDPRSKQMPPWAPKKSFQRVAEFYLNH